LEGCGFARDHRARRAGPDLVDVERRLPEVLFVVALTGRLAERRPAGSFDDLESGDVAGPPLALFRRRALDAGAQFFAQDAVRTGKGAVEHAHELVDRVRDAAAVQSGVEIALARPDRHARRDDAASAEGDRRTE